MVSRRAAALSQLARHGPWRAGRTAIFAFRADFFYTIVEQGPQIKTFWGSARYFLSEKGGENARDRKCVQILFSGMGL